VKVSKVKFFVAVPCHS